MKKILLSIAGLLTVVFANAQQTKAIIPNEETIMPLYIITGTVALAGLVIFFILIFLKRFMDFRLKNKIIDKGVSETIAVALLQTDKAETRNANVKWFALLMGIGIGSTIVYYTLPLNVHSIAIMAFSMAASFLGYYLYLKFQDK